MRIADRDNEDIIIMYCVIYTYDSGLWRCLSPSDIDILILAVLDLIHPVIYVCTQLQA